MPSIKETIAAIEARHNDFSDRDDMWSAELMNDFLNAESDRATLLRICKAQQAVVEACQGLQNTATQGTAESVSIALTAVRAIEHD